MEGLHALISIDTDVRGQLIGMRVLDIYETESGIIQTSINIGVLKAIMGMYLLELYHSGIDRRWSETVDAAILM